MKNLFWSCEFRYCDLLCGLVHFKVACWCDGWDVGLAIARSLVRLPVGSLSSGYSTSMIDCLRTGKPFRYITNTKANLAFHPSGVPACVAGVTAERVHLCRVAGNTVIPYGRWRSVALRWVTNEDLYHLTILIRFTIFCMSRRLLYDLLYNKSATSLSEWSLSFRQEMNALNDDKHRFTIHCLRQLSLMTIVVWNYRLHENFSNHNNNAGSLRNTLNSRDLSRRSRQYLQLNGLDSLNVEHE